MQMKKSTFLIISILLIALTLQFASHSQQAQNAAPVKTSLIKWYSFEDAYNLSKKKKKKIFVDVYTEWCGWCKKMDAETFTNPVIAKYMMDNFYCVKFDAERKDTIVIDGKAFINPNPASKRSTHQLASQLLRGSMSYPSYVFLNEEGQLITVVPGYHNAKSFEAILSFFGEGIYKNLSQADFQTKFNEYTANFQGKIK